MSIKLPIILLDPGHGSDTPGKRSPDATAGKTNSPLYFREFSWARKCACGICDVLQAEGYTAFLLVKEEKDVPLRERTERIKAYCRQYGTANVIVVSVHVNAAAGSGWHDARGLSIYTSPGQTKSDNLATCIYEAAVEELTKRTYGHPYRSPSAPTGPTGTPTTRRTSGCSPSTPPWPCSWNTCSRTTRRTWSGSRATRASEPASPSTWKASRTT